MNLCQEWILELAEEVEIPRPDRAYNHLPVILSRGRVNELLHHQGVPERVRLGWRGLYSGCLRPHELHQLSGWDGVTARINGRTVVFDEETAAGLRQAELPGLDELRAWWEEKLGSFYAGLSRRAGLQTLRHAGAVHCLENGMDSIALYRLLGLDDYQLTGIYTRAAVGLRRAEYAATHPLMVGELRSSMPVWRSQPIADSSGEEEGEEEEEAADHAYARLSLAELRILLQAISNPKHRLVVRLLYASGLRRAELVGLDFDDFCTEEGRIFVRSGKGGKDRSVLVDPETLKSVLALKKRGAKSEIFELGVHSVYDILDRAAARSGLDKKFAAQGLKLSPHSLRNTFATHCYLGGMSSACLSALLGHNKMSTLLDYLECGPERRQQAYDHAHA